MAKKRNPFPQPNSIREYTHAELIRRKINLDISKLAIPTPTIMPFVRFTSTKTDTNIPNSYRFFHLGLHGFPNDVENTANIFELTYGGEDVVGYAFKNGKRKPILSTDSLLTKDDVAAEGRHPIPGVTSISVEHMGANEPIRTTVSWTCFNKTQLEFLRQHFLMAGGYVIIEFGHEMSNRSPTPVFDFSNTEAALKKLTDFVIEGRGIMSDEMFAAARGNYNMVIGRVVDTNISYGEGVINCITTFYSTGEAIFGIHNNLLLGRLRTKRERDRFTQTIAEFFGERSTFDNMLAEPERERFVIQMRAEDEKEVKRTAGKQSRKDKKAILEKFNATDSVTFIPWEMFITDVMKELFSAVKEADVSADAALFGMINKDEPAVGNHRALASTDPDTMVIVKDRMIQLGGSLEQQVDLQIAGEAGVGLVDPNATFAISRKLPNGHPRPIVFVSGSGGHMEEKGLLTNGVWLNTDAIKEAFQTKNTFYDAFIHLLSRMNNATENYWSLDLAFDEETKQYKVYDKKCVFTNKSFPTPYVFNKDTVGELLSFTFDASFSNEAKTAILLAKPQTRQELKASGNDLGQGTYNQPNIWSQVMNIPELKDELGNSVQHKRIQELRNVDRAGGVNTLYTRIIADVTRIVEAAEKAKKEDEQEALSRLGILARFASVMGPYIAIPSRMLATIFEDGIANLNTINNYVAPIPTEINLSLMLQGITGFAFYDTFLVDKLPRIYEDHGVFLINDIKHAVDIQSGWTTTLGGLFYFVNPKKLGQRASTLDERRIVLTDNTK